MGKVIVVVETQNVADLLDAGEQLTVVKVGRKKGILCRSRSRDRCRSGSRSRSRSRDRCRCRSRTTASHRHQLWKSGIPLLEISRKKMILCLKFLIIFVKYLNKKK
jgi:hypothetical protein